MQPIESTFIDKSAWGHGPWQNEPDKVEWRYRGLPCLIVRAPHTGALCGYVGLPPGHPYHGADGGMGEPEELRVHGGITYGARCQEDGKICHVPAKGESDDVWWLGFDCSHAGDLSPGLNSYYASLGSLGSLFGGTYRDLDYVRNEVHELADQILEAAN